MKKRLANFWYFGLIFFSCIFSCSEEKFEESSGVHFGVKTKSIFKARHLKNSSLTKAINLLETASQKASKFDMSFRSNEFGFTNIGVIDFSEVIEITDSLGKTYTTFKMKDHPEDDYKIFHNLLLENENGELNLKLIQYEMSDEFVMKYYYESANFIEFTGIMTTNFLTEQKYPCIEEISGGNSGGGSGGGSSGGGSSGGGSSGGGSSGGGSSGGGSGISNWYIQCLDCGDTFSDWGNFSGSQCDIWSSPITIVFVRSVTLENFNINYYDPCLQQPLVTAMIDPGSRNERCKKMSIMSNSPAYTNYVNELNGYSYGQKEYAKVYRFANNSTTILPPITVASTASNGSSVNVSNYLGTAFGFFHNHTTKTDPNEFAVPIFSPADINMLFKVAEMHVLPSPIVKDLSLYFVGLSYHGRNFQIKINSDLIDELTNYNTFDLNELNRKFIDDCTDKFQTTGSRNIDDYIKIFLNNITNLDFPIEVYEETLTTPTNGDSPYVSWKLLTLGNNGSIQLTDCITNK